ncbi:MAG: hypothetical protein DRJ97_07220 [Thermoprotei archaeon]|nr:MAG: hypothetical protein DRJ97_07220 [Thermoprotei archaeon]
MAKRVVLDHVAILVSSLDEALKDFMELLELSPEDVIVARGLEDADDVVDAAFLNLGGAWLEILAPAKPGGAMSRALEKRGEGLHHICFSTTDVDEELMRVKRLGLKLVDEKPRIDRFGVKYFYIHPSSTHRTLVCFIQRWVKTGPHSWSPSK